MTHAVLISMKGRQVVPEELGSPSALGGLRTDLTFSTSLSLSATKECVWLKVLLEATSLTQNYHLESIILSSWNPYWVGEEDLSPIRSSNSQDHRDLAAVSKEKEGRRI